MLQLVGDMLINEYKQNDFQVRVTTQRNTGALINIALQYNFQGETVMEIYYGSVAERLHKELLSAKVSKAIGGHSRANLKQFSMQGFRVKESEMSN